ncbi:sensor histidine kinase [Deinococcus kurensis]|uniref:sensor histidine kinase n=1 Tax=Deinococcus kurensis TaxID=2662757 RepID=UPI0012D2ACA2|nr:histidine kinase [Deinococcus kurensis]
MTVSPLAPTRPAHPSTRPNAASSADPRLEVQRTLHVTSLITWGVLSLHSLLVEPGRDHLPLRDVQWWGAVNLTFLAVMLLTLGGLVQRVRPATLALLLAQSGLALIANALLSGSSVQAGLMIAIAAQAALVLPLRLTLLWVAAQSAALLWVLLTHWHNQDAWAFTTGYLCFQGLAAMTVRTAMREIRARQALAAVVDELRATRALLADASRQAERLQISRDLHDLLGHHLTALGMHLQVAGHLLPPDAPARPHLLTAQQVTGDLLGDVRSAVRGLRHTACCDLPAELAALSAAAPVRVHLDWAPDAQVHCPVQAQVLLRSVQEILTNAARHARAAQVWLTVRRHAGTLHLHAHDDGPRRPAELRFGCGLSGMRERLESVGGTLEARLSPDRGVTLHLTLPARGAA